MLNILRYFGEEIGVTTSSATLAQESAGNRNHGGNADGDGAAGEHGAEREHAEW